MLDIDVPRVALVELYADGHHGIYLKYLIDGLDESPIIASVTGIEELGNFIRPDKLNIVSGCELLAGTGGFRRQRVAQKLFERCIKQAQKLQASHIHFLYADWHLSAIAAAWRHAQPSADPVLTAHWSAGVGAGGSLTEKLRRYPHRRALIWMIRNTRARLLVHHQAVKQELATLVDPARIDVIPYPVLPLPAVSTNAKRAFRQRHGIPERSKLILCFGDTRRDKGADLAVEALGRLPDSFHLLIAGKPDYFSPAYLHGCAQRRGVGDRLHFIPRFLPDEETAETFHSCNLVLLPYRKTFSGQSGPLTLAAGIGKPVAASNLPVLAQTLREFGLGESFASENIDAMVLAIRAAIENTPTARQVTDFTQYHSVASFSKKVCSNYRPRLVARQHLPTS